MGNAIPFCNAKKPYKPALFDPLQNRSFAQDGYQYEAGAAGAAAEPCIPGLRFWDHPFAQFRSNAVNDFGLSLEKAKILAELAVH